MKKELLLAFRNIMVFKIYELQMYLKRNLEDCTNNDINDFILYSVSDILIDRGINANQDDYMLSSEKLSKIKGLSCNFDIDYTLQKIIGDHIDNARIMFRYDLFLESCNIDKDMLVIILKSNRRDLYGGL